MRGCVVSSIRQGLRSPEPRRHADTGSTGTRLFPFLVTPAPTRVPGVTLYLEVVSWDGMRMTSRSRWTH